MFKTPSGCFVAAASILALRLRIFTVLSYHSSGGLRLVIKFSQQRSWGPGKSILAEEGLSAVCQMELFPIAIRIRKHARRTGAARLRSRRNHGLYKELFVPFLRRFFEYLRGIHGNLLDIVFETIAFKKSNVKYVLKSYTIT